MSVRISYGISLNILLGFILLVRGEHFFLPKENNVLSNDMDDWIPVSGIDKRSTRLNHEFTKVVHITPPVRYPNRPLNQQASASNKVEVFAQPPPTILGSFSEFGHATVEARKPAQALNFRPSYNFDRHYEINERRYQSNDYQESEDRTPPSIVVFNAQQRHPQSYIKTPPPPPPPPQFYQNFQYHNVNNNNNNKNFGFKEPPAIVQEPPPKRLTPYFVSNDHIFPRPQGNNKQVYAEQRPKPYLVSPIEPIQQQNYQQQQYYQQQQQPQKQQYKTTTEGVSSTYFQKYPGHVIDGQNLLPQVSNFARPFEQTGDRNVYIKPSQYVQDLNVGSEVRFGPEQPTRPALQELTTMTTTTTAGFAHPGTRPFSRFQTPTPKNEELYRIFPVKEVNALPAFLPTPFTPSLLQHRPSNGRPKTPYFKEPSGGSSEYDAREEQDENASGEQFDVLKSPTKPMMTTTTTTTTSVPPPPRPTRKRKPTTTTTTAAPLDEYDEYAVPNRQQLHVQEQQQEYQPSQEVQLSQQQYEPTIAAVTEPPVVRDERPLPVSVNKYKKKKPLPTSRPKEPQPEEQDDVPSATTTTATVTTTAAPVTTTTTAATTTTTTVTSQSSADNDARTKNKAKYGNGTRPRFSIKDYKTTTSTTTTSTERPPSVGRRTTTTAAPSDPETNGEQNSAGRKPYKPRPRPNRYRPSSSTTTTSTEEPQPQSETTTERAYRSKYKPGKYYNRLRTSTEAVAADESGETVTAAAIEPTKPAVYSAKRRTVPTTRTAPAVDESNAIRRSSSAAPLLSGDETMDVASSEDMDYVTTTAVTATATPAPRHKYHTSYAADRPLLPIESFFQSSMAGKRHRPERR